MWIREAPGFGEEPHVLKSRLEEKIKIDHTASDCCYIKIRLHQL